MVDANELAKQWSTDPRWRGIERTYSAEDVLKLRGTVVEEHTLARRGAEALPGLSHRARGCAYLGPITSSQSAIRASPSRARGSLVPGP